MGASLASPCLDWRSGGVTAPVVHMADVFPYFLQNGRSVGLLGGPYDRYGNSTPPSVGDYLTRSCAPLRGGAAEIAVTRVERRDQPPRPRVCRSGWTFSPAPA